MDSVTVVILLMLLSSCAAGYILGRSAFPESSGRRIDTILLTPDGDAAEQQMQQIFHLAGKINYTNGRPYAQGRVQLHSEPRETVTDTNGSFTFFHVEGGEHQIRILDRTGNVLGERKVNLFRLRRNQESMSACSKTGSIPLRWQSMSG